jgi:hypothetical protein
MISLWLHYAILKDWLAQQDSPLRFFRILLPGLWLFIVICTIKRTFDAELDIILHIDTLLHKAIQNSRCHSTTLGRYFIPSTWRGD